MIILMSTSTEGLAVPQWDLADRLAKSLRVSGMSVSEMAEYLDVHRNTVSAWMNGRTPPGTQSVRLWALRTGVAYGWLKDGIEPEDGPDGGGPGTGKPVGYLPSYRAPAQTVELGATG